jgi:dipeptidyl aminopeptidase/acylaminoacyl peptidase
MSDRTKKILLIIGFILIILLIAFLLYYVFFRPFIAPRVPIIPVNAPPAGGLPAIPPGTPIRPVPPALNMAPTLPTGIPTIPGVSGIPGPTVSFEARGGLTSLQTLETDASMAPKIAANGQDLIYYNTQTGFFYTVTPDGQKKSYSDVPFKDVQNVVWSPNNQKAILEYPDGSNIIYDFLQKKSVTLPAYWKDFSFAPDSQKIAFKDMRMDTKNRYISTADTNGGSYTKIEYLGEADKTVKIDWSPDNKYIAMSSEGQNADVTEVFPIGFHGENFKSYTVEGRDIRYLYSPNGNIMLYSAYNSLSDFNPVIWSVNIQPDLIASGRTKLELQTWADKCLFATEATIYCAVPRQLDTGIGMLPSLADSTPDGIYKINLATGSKELIAQPLFPTTIEKMIISNDGKKLYWLEKSTGQIKQMNL